MECVLTAFSEDRSRFQCATQGSAHGFLALKTIEGTTIAIGDVTQVIHGDRVTSRVTFHFRDGSLDDDITVFSQRRVFRLVSVFTPSR